MLTFKRFRALTASYGADLNRWPEEMRAEAAALLETSARARLLHAQARALDEAISVASAAENARIWHQESPEATAAKVRSRVASAIRAEPIAAWRRPIRRLDWMRSAKTAIAMRARFGWIGLATASCIVAATGLLVGSMYTFPARPAEDLLTILTIY